MKKEKTGYILLIILAIFSLIGVMILGPIEQKETYHNFTDNNTILNIPNFWNVISNLSFLIVGFWGLYKLNSIAKEKTQYLVFLLGIILVSIGSAYYHLSPDNTTLIWDRLPMTISFMALISIVTSEFISYKKGRVFLFPALSIGLLSIFYWIIFNDLRFYALVQFYPILAIPVTLIFFKSRYNRIIGYWILIIAYIIAKILEHYDSQVYDYLGFISGHSLKHIIASLGIFALLHTYLHRKENT